MNKLVNQLCTALQAPGRGKKGKRANPKPKAKRSGNGARLRMMRSSPLPAAYSLSPRSYFRMTSIRDTVRVSGCDLVYSVPSTLTVNTDFLFSCIPANPVYWTGTRIAQVARAYMNYRPINLKFTYVPQVAVTQAGTVVMGTLWNGTTPATDLQQTLLTSNGGMMTQCYVPCETNVRLGANLPQNLFTSFGDFNPDTIPFLFCAALRGASVIPGYFYVSYTYDLKNPVGSGVSYSRSGVSTTADLTADTSPTNTSIVLLATDATSSLGPGTILDVEGGTSVSYRGVSVTLDATTPFQIFRSKQGDF